MWWCGGWVKNKDKSFPGLCGLRFPRPVNPFPSNFACHACAMIRSSVYEVFVQRTRMVSAARYDESAMLQTISAEQLSTSRVVNSYAGSSPFRHSPTTSSLVQHQRPSSAPKGMFRHLITLPRTTRTIPIDSTDLSHVHAPAPCR